MNFLHFLLLGGVGLITHPLHSQPLPHDLLYLPRERSLPPRLDPQELQRALARLTPVNPRALRVAPPMPAPPASPVGERPYIPQRRGAMADVFSGLGGDVFDGQGGLRGI